MEKIVKVKIERQGAPIVNADNAIIMAKGKNVVAICVDLKSKYCEVDALTSSKNGRYEAILIGANDSSINLNKKMDRMDDTKIYFPEYEGWTIFSHKLTRYTLRVCLLKIKTTPSFIKIKR